MRQRNLGYERQDQEFYPTPTWVTEALLRQVRGRIFLDLFRKLRARQ
jgi:hypothetical protein